MMNNKLLIIKLKSLNRLTKRKKLLGFIGLLGLFSCDSSQQQIQDARYYTEPHRPQIHFSPEANWMNDPNGMLYYDGEYHLFYQYHPESTVWGPMHWGHAVSRDLVHWEHLPIGLYPDSLGTIFSGSAVVDWNHTTGFGEEGEPPLVAIFTQHSHELERAGSDLFQTQGIAFSIDKGRTWTMYEGNPVIPNPGIRDFRDPKVRWHEESQQWVMIFAAWNKVKIYTSPNLKEWSLASEFGAEVGTHGGVWECPDLFPLPIEGSEEQRWVMLVSINPGGPNGGSATQYFVGDFDGTTFSLDPVFAQRLGIVNEVVPPGRVFEPFEGVDFSPWTVEGTAFGGRPADGNTGDQEGVSGFTDKRLANSFHGGDEATGTLTSPIFVNEYRFLNFQIGGGQHPESTGIRLMKEGEVLLSATGNNKEQLSWKTWDVSEFLGQSVQLQIVDEATGDWGHILIDQILFSNEPVQPKRELAQWLEYGRDNYAGVTWSDIPDSDGRRIFMGWMSNWDYAQKVPTEAWRSAMTLPRRLELTPDLVIRSVPVKELENLRKDAPLSISQQQVEENVEISNEISGPVEIICTFTVEEGFEENSRVGLQLSNTLGEQYTLSYDPSENQLLSDRRRAGKKEFSDVFAYSEHIAPRHVKSKTVKMHVYVDLASAEMFADEGSTVLTDIFFPGEPFSKLSLISEGATLSSVDLSMYPLSSIWR